MSELLSTREPTARKEHDCMSAPFFDEHGWYDGDYRCPGKIKKGEKYINQSLKDGGEFYTFKAHILCHDICLEEELYES